MKGFVVGSLFLVVAALLSACGGGGGGPLPQAPPLQKVVVSNFQVAAVEIGQASFSNNSSNRPARPDTLRYPVGNPVVNNGVLYVPDSGNNRVLVYNNVPTSINASADFAIGQPDLTTNSNGNAANQMFGPQTVRIANGKLFVCDTWNNRILIWNTLPTTSGTSADVVVGQAGFGTSLGAAGQAGLRRPEDMTVAGNKLIVADSNNNRIMIWNTIPTANNAPADVVLGQGDFTYNRPNDDDQNGVSTFSAPTSRTLYYPTGVWSDGSRLVVADGNNNRVLIWKQIPTSNFAPADVVLGQADFNHSEANDNNDAASGNALYFPHFMDSNGEQLVIVDDENNRVLIWDSFPTTSFAPADRVLGQNNFTHSAENDDDQNDRRDLPTARTLYYPAGVFIYGSKLMISDSGNSRILIY